ncbi:hypothetical protein CR513_50977, partial [Mucuna pruriens]
MDNTSAVARHLISNMASNTQQFGIRGAGPSRMVNKIGAVDNLRLENQLTKLTSLVRQLAVGQHQPSTTARVYGIFTFMEHLTDICPTLQETELNHPKTVGAIGNNFGQVRVKGYMQLSDLDLPQVYLPIKVVIGTTIPTTTTIESVISKQLPLFGGPDKAVSNKQSRVPTKHELQQHEVPTKYECHHPRPQDANRTTSQHYESSTIGWVQKPSLTNNSKSEGEYKHSIIEK